MKTKLIRGLIICGCLAVMATSLQAYIRRITYEAPVPDFDRLGREVTNNSNTGTHKAIIRTSNDRGYLFVRSRIDNASRQTLRFRNNKIGQYLQFPFGLINISSNFIRVSPFGYYQAVYRIEVLDYFPI